MKKILLLTLSLIATAAMMQATVFYETKPLMTDEVKAYPFQPKDSAKQEYLKIDVEAAIDIPEGKIVVLKDTLVGYGKVNDSWFSSFIASMDSKSKDLAIIEYEGQDYAVEPHDLLFDDDKNAEGEKDYLEPYQPTKGQRRWYSKAPFIAIFVLLLAAFVMAWLATYSGKYLGTIFLIVNAAATVLATIIEMIGILRMGSDLFWWLDTDRYGYLTCILRMIPLLAAAAVQFGSIGLFFKAITKAFSDGTTELSLKPIIKILIYTVVAFFGLFILNGLTFQSRWVVPILIILLCVAGFGYFMWRQMSEYQKVLGTTVGLIFTIYATFWALSSIIAAIFYAMAAWKIIVPLIVTALALGVIAALFAAMPRVRYVRKDN